MTNVCIKGKRVERSIVNWLKDRGCPSARRSAQHCGKPALGEGGLLDNSDIIVPDELPSWHIESKGTTSPKLVISKVRNWFKQVTEDCPANKIPVILHTANAYAPVALMSFNTYKTIALSVGQMSIAAEESFCPAPDLIKMQKGSRIYAILTEKIKEFVFTGAIAFEYSFNELAIAVEAPLWLHWALEYEKKVKPQLSLVKA